MACETKKIDVSSGGQGDMIDITDKVQKSLSESSLKNGIVVVFCPGSTGAVSTVEFEPGLKKDIPKALQKIAPYSDKYEHHNTWNDDNGSGHVQATILGPSISIPFTSGSLVLGQWQQIVFIECDTRARKRELVVQLVGE